MEKVNINKLEKLNCSYNNESDIYIYNNDLVKIIKKDSVDKVRFDTIKELLNHDYDNCVMPSYLVSTYSSNKVCGYGMTYLKDYYPLTKYIENEVNLDKKKELINKINKLINCLYENGFCYIDIHGDNILFKDGDIELIDMDSGYYKKDLDNTNFLLCRCCSINFLSGLCLNILFNSNINFTKLRNDSKMNSLYGMSSPNQKNLLDHAMHNYLLTYNPVDNLDVDEEYINTAKKILKLH